jgi:DNA gyrase subunit A
VDVRDESTDVIRIVVEIKPDAAADSVMAYLFKHTTLQINFNVNLTALVPTGRAGVGQPARLTLLELCRHFLDFRREVVRRRLTHELRELRERLHILAGFLKLFDGLDRAIKLIRQSASRAEAQKGLMKTFALDEPQADAVLETRLYQLARLEIDKIRAEQREKETRAKEIERLLRSDKALWALVSGELKEIATRYGDARRTVLKAGAELTYDAEAYVVHEDTTVVVTRDGWMKRLGEIKDPSSTRVREGDQAKWILRGNTRDALALFSNFGVVYVMKVANVPASTGYGEPVQSLLNFKDGERIINAVLVTAAAPNGQAEPDGKPRQAELFGSAAKAAAAGAAARPPVRLSGAEQSRLIDRWIVATAGGMGFFCRPDLTETTRSGRRFARTKEADELIVVAPGEGDAITAASDGGKILSFAAEELPELAGAGRGVILMRLDRGENLVAAVSHPAGQHLVAVAEDGSERRFHPPELAHRAQKGRKALKRFKVVDLVSR